MLEATLLADGTSDRVLLPFLEFLLDEHCDEPYVLRFAEGIRQGPLVDRVVDALEQYPCDVLFVHRDAEQQPVAHRELEIDAAVSEVDVPLRHVKVIPVRMTESWLLLDEQAIRAAANNRRGQVRVSLPAPAQCESVDAKAVLLAALATASGLGARRLLRFSEFEARLRVPFHIQDFVALRRLSSFRHCEQQVVELFA